MLYKIHVFDCINVLGRAREIVFRPEITGQIKDKVALCEMSNEIRDSQAKQHVKPNEIPERT